MPYELIQGKKIYYEIHGEGEVLVLLNGIMMSTASWAPFIKVFSKEYKLVLVDLIDQGKSDKAEGNYTQYMHAEMLNKLFEKLNLTNVNLMGVSYGGEVAMIFALKYQEKLKSLILANTTSYTSKILKHIGDAWINAASSRDTENFLKLTFPTIYSYKYYEERFEWLENRINLFKNLFTKEWYDGFIRAVKSAENLNIVNDVSNIKIPTLIISSDLDVITFEEYQREIKERIKNSRWVLIKDAGHASMYEKPNEFILLVYGFLKTYDTNIEII